MPKILTESQIERFRRDGCVFPIRVMPEAEALEIRASSKQYETKSGGPLAGDLRHKTHLLFPWLADLVRNSAHRRRDRGFVRAESAVLDHQLLHQGSKQPCVRLLASGLDLLGAQPARRRHRVGRADAEQSSQRCDDIHSRHAHCRINSSTATRSRRTTC